MPRPVWSAVAIVAIIVSTIAVILPVWPHLNSDIKPEKNVQVEEKSLPFETPVIEDDPKADPGPETGVTVERQPVEEKSLPFEGVPQPGPRLKPDDRAEPPPVEDVARSETQPRTEDLAEPQVIEEGTRPVTFAGKVALKVIRGGCNDTGFCCFSDERRLAVAIRSIAGVYRCEFNGTRREATVIYDREKLKLEDIQRVAAKAGFQVALLKSPGRE
ncbi:MAG: hypothetical protein L0229_30655 [Blastocatellia bacterium]|nr:hypothetical protein [Blastocatellia bacterium]